MPRSPCCGFQETGSRSSTAGVVAATSPQPGIRRLPSRTRSSRSRSAHSASRSRRGTSRSAVASPWFPIRMPPAEAQRRSLEHGPSAIRREQFANWPVRQVQQLFCGAGSSEDSQAEAAALRRRRFEALLCSGSIVYSDYSGMQGPEVMMRMQHQALAEAGINVRALSDNFMTMWRACDSDPLCTQLAMTGKHKPVHYLKDIIGRLPREQRDMLIKYDPKPGKRKHLVDMSASAEAYRRMDEHLTWSASDAFHWGRRSASCMLHPGAQCLVSSKTHLVMREDDAGAPPPITELIAGPMCTPWSAFGTELGLGDPATKPWVCFVNQAAALKYDLTWVENSPFFPVELLEQKWETSHKILWVVAGPEHLGWPIFRRRLFAVGIARETLVWVGPSTAAGVQEAFYRFFRARCAVRGGDIFIGIDSEEQRRAAVRAMSQVRGVWTKAGEQVNYRQLLPQRAQDFYDAYVEIASRGDQCMIADMSQNPAKRPRYGAWMPTATRSSEMFCMTHPGGPEKFTGNELFFAHGWPLASTSLGDKFRGCLNNDISGLTPPQHRKLRGKGMHLTVLSAWTLFVKRRLLRIDRLQKMPPPMPPAVVQEQAAIEGDGCESGKSSGTLVE